MWAFEPQFVTDKVAISEASFKLRHYRLSALVDPAILLGQCPPPTRRRHPAPLQQPGTADAQSARAEGAARVIILEKTLRESRPLVEAPSYRR